MSDEKQAPAVEAGARDERILAEKWHQDFIQKCGYPPDAEDGYAAGYRAASSRASQAAAGEPLRRAVKAVVAMLKNGEYAEHWADAEAPGDADAADLEAAITELVSEANDASEQQCVGCEGKPAPGNNPCGVCGASERQGKCEHDWKISMAHRDGNSPWVCAKCGVREQQAAREFSDDEILAVYREEAVRVCEERAGHDALVVRTVRTILAAKGDEK